MKPYAGTVIADRAFNAERRAAAQPGAASLGEYEARWEPSNPNVLTMTCRGKVRVRVRVRVRISNPNPNPYP